MSRTPAARFLQPATAPLVAALAALLIGGCAQDVAGPGPGGGVIINPPSAPSSTAPASMRIAGPAGPLTPGAAATLTAIVYSAAGDSLTRVAARWSSSEAAVAVVGENGVVIAQRAGTAVMTASWQSLSAKFTISVGAPPAT